MSRRETRSTATAAVAATGDSSEDGSNNKRKRDDDYYNENDHQEDDDGSNTNNGDAKPEAVLSIDQKSDDEDDIDIDVPDGEFPSAPQLGRILALVEAVPAGKFDDESYERMEMFYIWTDHGHNKEDLERWMRVKLDFLMLGGLMRMIYLIARHMKDRAVVQAASNISANLMYFHNVLDDDTKTQMQAAATYAIRADALRTLLLSSEEFIPSNEHGNWLTAEMSWRAMLNICANTKPEQIDCKLLQPIVEANIMQYCLSDPTQFRRTKVCIASFFASVVWSALRAHEDMAKKFVEEQKIMDSFLNFSRTYMDAIVDVKDPVNRILSLCCVCFNANVFTSEDMKKWLPFVTTTLSAHLTDNIIEQKAHSFVDRAVDTISHRELDSTPLMDTLLSIIKSSDTPEELKPKYRALMTKILS